MKKVNLSFVFNIVIGIAVVVLYILFFSRATSNTETPSAVGSPASSSIVYINSDSLMEKYELVKVVTDELEKEQENREAEFAVKYKALEKKYVAFQERAHLLSQQGAENEQKQLMAEEQKLMKIKDDLSFKLAELKQKRNDELQNKILDYIKKYNVDHRFTYVLGKSTGGGILFASDSLDITNDIINGLNKEYAESTPKE